MRRFFALSMTPLGGGAMLAGALTLMSLACASDAAQTKTPTAASAAKPSLSLFVPPSEPPDPAPTAATGQTLLVGATLHPVASASVSTGYLLLEGGKIAALGPMPVPEGLAPQAQVIDVTGRHITPGLIDTHSHIGVYPWPSADAHADGNEATAPVTADVWAEHGFWPQDPGLWRAIEGGVTTIQVLPGSANLIGGRSFVAKTTPKVSARAMRFVGAPQGLKMACGENPKRVYGSKGRAPSTRMGNVAGYRAAFQRAVEYGRRLEKYERDLSHYLKKKRDAGGIVARQKKVGDPPDPVGRDFQSETLLKVLRGEMLVHNHCYRADEMSLMLDVADEFGFSIRSFHHALEAYKIADRLAADDVSVSTWADWWGFKLEANDAVPYNAAMLADAGAKTIIHSDSARDGRRLNHEAAKAAAYGRDLGIETTPQEVLKWITQNPAWALGVDAKTGVLKPGYAADVVVWDGPPLSIYARTERVFVDGVAIYERARTPAHLGGISDFEVSAPDSGGSADAMKGGAQ